MVIYGDNKGDNLKNLIIVLVIVIIVIIIVHQTTRASENKSINSPTEPSPFIQLIMDEKIAGLEKLSAITDLNSSFKASKYTDNNPLEFA